MKKFFVCFSLLIICMSSSVFTKSTLARKNSKQLNSVQLDSLFEKIYSQLLEPSYYVEKQFECNNLKFDSTYQRSDTLTFSFNRLECEILYNVQKQNTRQELFLKTLLDTISSDYINGKITSINYFFFIPEKTIQEYNKHSYSYYRRITAIVMTYLIRAGIHREDIHVKITLGKYYQKCNLPVHRQNVVQLYCN